MCELAKAKQGIMLRLALPRETPSNIKESISAIVGIDELKKETGMYKFAAAMNEAFKQTNKIPKLEIYTDYYVNMKEKEEESVSYYMNRFDKGENFVKCHEMDLPPKVKGLKLLHDAGMSNQDLKLMLTRINFEKKDKVYKQARKGLSKCLRNESQAERDLPSSWKRSRRCS